MRSSRLGIIVLIASAVLLTTNCTYYNRVMSRKNLVDGSTAYKDRKFEAAEELFRRAADRDPEGETLEGRTAQLFLARTLHQRFSGNRSAKEFAEKAVVEYNKAIPQVLREFAAAKQAYEGNKTNSAEPHSNGQPKLLKTTRTESRLVFRVTWFVLCSVPRKSIWREIIGP